MSWSTLFLCNLTILISLLPIFLFSLLPFFPISGAPSTMP